MKKDWREEEKLRHLTGAHDASGRPRRNSGAREIGGALSQKSMGELAAAALADIESNKPRRKYSTDEAPPEVVIRRSRVKIVVLGVLVFVLVRVASTTLKPGPPPIPGDPVEVFAVLSPAAQAGVPVTPEWSSARAGEGGTLGERERAIRIGALIVEMERDVARSDSTMAQGHAEAIAAILSEVAEGSDAAGLFTNLKEARALSSRHALAPFAREAPMALGAWIQGARVAALLGDAGFFASLRSRESMRLLLGMQGVTPEVQTARDLLDTILRRRGLPDFTAASGALEILQRELAN
jgi:hypothetical protein